MAKSIMALLVLLVAANLAEAQVRDRWHLDWKNEKPQMFVYRTPDDKIEVYWYLRYEVVNRSSRPVPIIVDPIMYVETGREMLADISKVDRHLLKDRMAAKGYDMLVLRDGRKVYGKVTFSGDKYDVRTSGTFESHSGSEVVRWVKNSGEVLELLKYGRYHSPVTDPIVEFKIIESVARLGNRSPGIVRESIEAYKRGFTRDPKVWDPAEKNYLVKDSWLKGRWKKGDRLFLSPREMRRQRYIQPGQKLGGLAIFRNVSNRAKRIEVQVSGLVDIVKIEPYEEGELEEKGELAEMNIVYENRVLKIIYAFPGDEVNRIEDMVLYKSREWTAKKIGPIADKETIGKLVDAMVQGLRNEKDWKGEGKTGEEIAALREKEGIGPLDIRIIARTLQLATGQEFGFDPSATILGNEKSIWRMHEWWLTNKSRLAFNEITNRYEVVRRELPGTVDPDANP
jgi:hypothetical protein